MSFALRAAAGVTFVWLSLGRRKVRQDLIIVESTNTVGAAKDNQYTMDKGLLSFLAQAFVGKLSF